MSVMIMTVMLTAHTTAAAATRFTRVVRNPARHRMPLRRTVGNTGVGKTRHGSELRFTSRRGETQRRRKTQHRGKIAAPSWSQSAQSVPGTAGVPWVWSLRRIICSSWDKVVCRLCLLSSCCIAAATWIIKWWLYPVYYIYISGLSCPAASERGQHKFWPLCLSANTVVVWYASWQSWAVCLLWHNA